MAAICRACHPLIVYFLVLLICTFEYLHIFSFASAPMKRRRKFCTISYYEYISRVVVLARIRIPYPQNILMLGLTRNSGCPRGRRKPYGLWRMAHRHMWHSCKEFWIKKGTSARLTCSNIPKGRGTSKRVIGRPHLCLIYSKYAVFAIIGFKKWWAFLVLAENDVVLLESVGDCLLDTTWNCSFPVLVWKSKRYLEWCNSI